MDGVADEVRLSQWWTGTICKSVSFPLGKFSVMPSVFVTAAHHHAGLKRDAASVWIEDVTQSSFKVCLRELQNYAGSHEDVHVIVETRLPFIHKYISDIEVLQRPHWNCCSSLATL